MNTVIDNLQRQAETIKSLVTEFINNHAEIYRWNEPDSPLLVIGGGDYAWKDLQPEGKRLQSKTLNEFRHFHAIIKVLLRDQPKDEIDKLNECTKTITEIIEQNSHLYSPDKNKVLNEAISSLDRLLDLIDHIYTAEEDCVLVPDTNALLHNPAIETWHYDGVSLVYHCPFARSIVRA